ncbi:MAG: SH3 domain-containing protein [Chloroflexi bacterium]|nr:SH3 domain-containing protein [Chloroflexota bacterium]
MMGSKGHRFLLIVLFIFGLILTPTTLYAASLPSIPASSSLQGGASASANNLINVRAGPGIGFWAITLLNPGETVPVMGVSPDGGWWYVNTAAGMGWVSKGVVTASNTGGVPVQDPGPIVTVTAAELNVRGGPGEASIVVGRVNAGSQLFLLGRSGDGQWLNVRSEFGDNTWVAARFTSLGDATAAPSSTGSLPVTEAETYAIVNAAYLNVRSGPSTNYAIIGTVVGGERLPIIGRDATRTWYNVQTVYGEGWVSARYVAARNEFGNAPVTTGSVDTTSQLGPFAIINTGALNIRSGPSASYTVLAVTRGGDQHQILAWDPSYSWLLIDADTVEGWVSRRFVIIRGDTSVLPVTSASGGVTDPNTGQTVDVPAQALGPQAYVATGALNIRSGPNVAFESIGVVYSTTRMTITGQSPDGRWWQVSSPFGTGWVNKSYIIAEGDVSGVPVVQ